MNISAKHLFNFLIGILLISLIACSEDNPNPISANSEGFFIVNEGGFPNDNSSISYFDLKTKSVVNDIFSANNQRSLGVQAQSMTVHENKGYIIVQGSAKIEVIDANTFKSIATITEGIESPRYVIILSDSKAYVSDWGEDGVSGTIKVLDLTTNTITKSIAIGEGPNRMLKVGEYVYVTNAGGYGQDNTVKVLNSKTDAIEKSIEVGDNPNSIQQDAAGNIWVASAGAIAYNQDWSIDTDNSTPGSISKIVNQEESLRLTVSNITYSGVNDLGISPDGKTLYYTYNSNVYKMTTQDTSLPTSTFVNKSYYGFTVSPIDGTLIGTLAPNFSTSGSIEILDQDGKLIETHTVGIGPNGASFK
jgi:YVTN family beta-propeller protein